ncbi:MAG: amidase [Rhodospirillales bacterium]|nr:amidase [Rhodospirillales bacterium]
MPDPALLSLTEAAALIAARRLSPVELTRAVLARIAALDPMLDAYLLLTEDQAMDAARQAEAEIAGGTYRGPMHGIPVALKDIYCTRGIRTTSHSRSCADFIPDFDATAVARLHQAGAVLLGKLATHEFAHGGPSFDLPWPPARNPWDRARFTGGSSSGSGAAVAAGLAMAALGSDTGGSIRNPASLCGIVGLKPSYGLVSRAGIYPNSFSYDHAGPLTWTVEDCAIVLQAIAGHDPDDPASAMRAVPDFRRHLHDGVKGLRIGILSHLHQRDVPAPASVQAALAEAIDVFRRLGAVIGEARIAPAQDYYDVKLIAAESELLAVHAPALRRNIEDFGEDFLGRSLGALLMSGADAIAASRRRRAMLAQAAAVFARFDVLITAAPGPAPLLESWRTLDFWAKPSLTTPFNVLAGPALAQCIGFTADGLPLGMQIIGRPFDDATVLRAAQAYERATSWRSRRPVLDPSAPFSRSLPAIPDPAPSALSASETATIEALCRRAGMRPNARHLQQLCATAPYVWDMTARLQEARGFRDEPSSIFLAAP